MRARGYLMLEIMVGGAMAAVVLVGMLSFISSGRVKNIAASRDVTANQLVNEMMEKKRASAYPPTAVSATTLAVAGSNYVRTVTTSATGCPEVRTNPGVVVQPAISMPCTNVNVIVTFSITDGGKTKLHTASASMRMYP